MDDSERDARRPVVCPRSWCGSAAVLVAAFLFMAGPDGVVLAQDSPLSDFPMLVEYDVGVGLPDGTRLSADVYRPLSEEPGPTVFSLTPYSNNGSRSMEQAWSFVERGYAYVAVDVRGRYDSEGVFDPWRTDGKDGSAVMDWIAGQPWSDGTVATTGGSYSGMNQWLMAKEANPHHAAIVSYVAPADGFHDAARFDGVPKVDLIFTWSAGMYGRVNQSREGWNWSEIAKGLPLHTLGDVVGRPMPYWRGWMEHDRLDGWWDPIQMTGHYADFDVPSLNVTGWWDGQLLGATRNYENAVRTGDPDDHALIVGPWLHGVNRNRRIGVRDYGPDAIIDLDGIRDGWLDHRMQGNARPDIPRVMYFLQGKNEWRRADSWPPPGTQSVSWHLDSDGNANTLFGDGTLREEDPGEGPPDAFTYDPMNPVPTVSSRTAGARGGIAQGSVDNRVVELREDVLVYTSEPLESGLEVVGPVSATIFFSTDVPDTDITVKLLEIDSGGRALNLSHGIARARYRNSFREPELLEQGEVYGIQVTLFPTGHWFAPGHRIRVEVSSSNFPVFGRNLNVAGSSETSSEHQVAHTRIHHSSEHPSRIVLPVVGRGEGGGPR